MPKKPPHDEDSAASVSPYGPKATPANEPEPVPPVVPPEAEPPVDAPPPTLPSPPAPYSSPPPPAPYGSVPSSPYPAAHPVPYGVPVPQPYYSGPPKPPTTLSLLSMIFGIAGVVLFCCWGAGILFAIPAIILGHLGRKREAARGLSLTGLITGYVVIGLAVIAVIVAIISVVAGRYGY